MSDRTATVVLAIVVAMWVANNVATMFVESWHPSESINTAFTAIVIGSFLARNRVSQDELDKKEKKNKEGA
jgi:hypothetical protein